jgi:hypothetical protein
MRFSSGLAVLWVCAMVLLSAVSSSAAQGEGQLTADQLETHWAGLLRDEPDATRAAIALAQHPEEASQFLALKLKPLLLSADRLEKLLVDLGSERPQEWQAAFCELEYFDPRLAMGLEEVMDLGSVQTSPARNRVVAILSGRSYDGPDMKYMIIKLEPVGTDGFNFRGSMDEEDSGGAWWAEHKVERLNTGWRGPKKEWTRAVRALAILESFGTEQSWSVIETMAAGHPDAQPTKVSREMLERRQKQP